MAVGISGIQTCRCHDAIHRHLADNLGEKTGKKIDWPVLAIDKINTLDEINTQESAFFAI